MISRALVTGGAGFIGSHVVDSLLADGVAVAVIDDLSSGDAARVAPEAELQTFSIVDAARLDSTVDSVRPDAVFHLAAQASVMVSVADPGHDCAVNVHGTLNVLEASKRHGAPVVFASTGGALYGNEAPIPTPETSIPAPLAPYGASKWAAEAYVNTWAGSTGIPHAICRLGNVYGPRQSPHGEAGVVAIFAEHIYTGRTPRMFGHGAPTRDYIHVFDVVAAMRAACGHRGTFNIATAKGRRSASCGRSSSRSRAPRSSPSSHLCEKASWSARVSTPAGPGTSWGPRRLSTLNRAFARPTAR